MILKAVRWVRDSVRRWWDWHVQRELSKDEEERAQRQAMVRRLEAEARSMHRRLRRSP